LHCCNTRVAIANQNHRGRLYFRSQAIKINSQVETGLAGGDDGASMNQLAGRLADTAGAGIALAEKAIDRVAFSRNEGTADKIQALILQTSDTETATAACSSKSGVTQGRRSSMA
jgi:hypothetical protein